MAFKEGCCYFGRARTSLRKQQQQGKGRHNCFPASRSGKLPREIKKASATSTGHVRKEQLETSAQLLSRASETTTTRRRQFEDKEMETSCALRHGFGSARFGFSHGSRRTSVRTPVRSSVGPSHRPLPGSPITKHT